MKLRLTIPLAMLALTATLASAQQGVTKDQITLGSIQDLSGPIAGFGKAARQGMQLRVDEINEQGGIHGRQLKMLFEDSAYDPKKAFLSAQKLVNQDRIFMMLGHMGTAQNMAALPVQAEKNVVNFFPLSAARQMYEPLSKLNYSFMPTYYDGMLHAVPKVVKEKGLKKVCTIYQDDEGGLEVLRGAEAGLKTIGMEFTEKTSFKRGATDFSSQVAKMQAAGCDMVVLGTIIRETVGTIATARKMDYTPVFLANSAAYTDLIHKLGGAAMNGLYAPTTVQVPYLDDASAPIRLWATKYKTKFNEDPAVHSAYGYFIVDTFAKVAAKAGKDLNTESFVKAMETMVVDPDIFGSPRMTFSATKHLGSEAFRLSQIQDGRWTSVSDYFNTPATASGKAR